jgi:hypothetical protein
MPILQLETKLLSKYKNHTDHTLNMEESSISQQRTFQLVGGFLINLTPEPRVALAGQIV